MTENPAASPVRHQRSLLWRSLQGLCRIATTLAFDLEVHGLQHVPRTGGVLLLSNHQSYLDPILVGVRLRRPVSYMARATLFDNPLFGTLISNLHAYPVRQGEGDVGAIRETIRRLREGHILNIFPEGHRTDDGAMLPLESGVALVVKRAAVPVVPVMIEGSFAAWPRSRRFPRPHPIRVLYGPPRRLDHLKGAHLIAELQRTFQSMQAELSAKEYR